MMRHIEWIDVIREKSHLNSKQRVKLALEKKVVDRIPVALWMHPATTTMLSNYFEIPTHMLDDILLQDVRQIWVNNNYSMEGIVHENDGETHTDDWGIEWVRRYGFNQIKRSPYSLSDISEINQTAFPYDKIDSLMKPMEELADRSTNYFLGCDISPCGFELYSRLRGMEEALVDCAVDYKKTSKAIGACLEFSHFLAEEALKRFDLDWLWTGDDVAGQLNMLMSPELWRKIIKPGLAKIFEVAKSKDLPVAYHCCGSLYPIIGDLIDIGLDVLHPIQPNCPNMDPSSLKKEFGKDIAFIGGLDTQELIPKASAKIVKEETKKLIDIMTSDGGGFILAASHTVPPETPLENIMAIYEAIAEIT